MPKKLVVTVAMFIPHVSTVTQTAYLSIIRNIHSVAHLPGQSA